MSTRACLKVGILISVFLCLGGLAPAAFALDLTGTVNALISDGGSVQILFNCSGENPCRGTYVAEFHDPACTNVLGRVDSIVFTGLNLSSPGTISGTVTLVNSKEDHTANPDGSCSPSPVTPGSDSFAFTGAWNGSSGNLTVLPFTDGNGAVATISGNLALVSQLVQVSGSVTGSGADGGSGQISFACTGQNPCTGTYTAAVKDSGCSNTFTFSDTFAMVGLDLSSPGPISGMVVARNLQHHDTTHPDGTCTINAGSADGIGPFTGSWNGTSGTITVNGADFATLGGFTASVTPTSTGTTPPIFQMTVTANITPTVSNASAQIQYRPVDVGTTGSVYVFAVAPSTIVKSAAVEKDARVPWKAQGVTTDTPVQCVLAQLNASGQLQAVSASNLQAYVTGVLSGQGQAVTILNGVPTAQIAGATFYVGYGASPTQMINNGVNRSAVSVSGSITCQPQAPQTGWWWNTSQGGRGYSIEVQANHVFFASYLYDVSGRATWLVASGNTSLDGSLFNGQLESYAQGQALAGAYKAPNPVVYAGAITLAFSDASHGSLIWPGGTVAIERFNVVPNGLTAGAQQNQPEAGWWWNPSESGRGFFLEWQGGELFMAGYMYDDNGNPIWYLSSNGTPSTNLLGYTNTWWQYANGQTLTGAFKPATQVNNNVGPVSITFQGADTAIMTLPGGRVTPIKRFRF